MNEINEKLSALYDGELNAAEVDELIDIISKVIKDKEIQKLKPKPRNWFRKRQIRKLVSQ